MYKETIKFLSSIGLRYFPSYLKPLSEVLKQSGMRVLFEIYVGKMFFFSFISFILIFIGSMCFFVLFIGLSFPMSLIGSIILGGTSSFGILAFFHTYPFQLVSSRKRNIEGNLPFAANHMAAIASSGIPPHIMFKLLMDVKEYGEIGMECKKIVRNVETFGMDINSAIKDVADRTPSPSFRQFLYSIISTISTGGDLKKFLQGFAKEALFDYRVRRERYLSALSVYADFYTAVLIAAPLFFISILSVMAMIGGQIMGLSIPQATQLGTYGLIPILNILFLIFIHFTQPSV